jgi:hypothetical protein
VQTQVPVELAQDLERGAGIVATVAHLLADDRPVLLLDEAVVVPCGRAGTG